MKNAFIEIPADEQYFPIGELPRMFADAVPCWPQADTDLGQQAVNIVRARKDFWPQIEADAQNGTLPVRNPSSRLAAPYPSAAVGEYGKHFLITREALKEYAAATFGIDVREKAEEPAALQVLEQPEQEQVESEAQEWSSGTEHTPRRRLDNLGRAVIDALNHLPPAPTIQQVFDYLVSKDETGYVRGRDGDELTWENGRGDLSRTSKKSLANRLTRLIREQKAAR